MHKVFQSIILIVLLSPISARAQSDQPWSANFFLENDLFANTDLNYTNGIRFSTISPDLESFQDPDGQKYPWVERLNNLLEFVHPSLSNPDADPVHQNMVISLGQLMFTPSDSGRTTLDPDDRPYAGYLYLGLGYHARTSNTLHSTEFNFGVVGPAALARQSQDLVHRVRGLDKFQGWDNQLKNEAAFQLIFERKHKNGLINTHLLDGLQLDSITHWGASLGNVGSYLNAGAELRIGWDLPDDFGTSTLRPGGDNNTPGNLQNSDTPFRFHGFVASDARLVANNIFLDGNTLRNSHSVDRKYLVADMAIGIAGSYKKLRFSYAHIYRSREFSEQRKAQFYGSFSLSYRYTFN
ncbi:MAG: lipid A deacylase LpxR family protein [Gammaproteobacteria bacterium]|jgi:lipid A 3-O-deacylase|nr:lipid A deacylase LpxR family protein [Gammaproteobacteria bacterium]MBT6042026.1 lipid A deacylase LpxR family protein [Gammaproteobacteria bacterium]